MSKIRVALGPEMPGWGSWEWIGADMVEELSRYCQAQTFTYGTIPDADVVIIIKHPPRATWLSQVKPQSLLIYAPVDYYDSLSLIDADANWLSQMNHIVVHCHRLRHYFLPYADTSYLDHHVKYVSTAIAMPVQDGPILWVGVHTNLPPLIDWVNKFGLPSPLLVLTNFEQEKLPTPMQLGFQAKVSVKVERWTPARHLESLLLVRAAIDVKGEDFQSRHKPPTKAIDFLAAGLPLALNPNSSPHEHLAAMGFKATSPDNSERWFSPEYADECRQLGEVLRQQLSRERIGFQWWQLVQQVSAR